MRYNLLAQLIERADRDEFAVLHDAHARAKFRHVREDVTRKDDRLAQPRDLQKQLTDLDARPRVEARGGFVEDENARVVDQHAGESEALF